MIQHRWTNGLSSGRWCATPDEALFDALRAGQAALDTRGHDEIVLTGLASVEAGQLETTFGS